MGNNVTVPTETTSSRHPTQKTGQEDATQEIQRPGRCAGLESVLCCTPALRNPQHPRKEPVAATVATAPWEVLRQVHEYRWQLLRGGPTVILYSNIQENWGNLKQPQCLGSNCTTKHPVCSFSLFSHQNNTTRCSKIPGAWLRKGRTLNNQSRTGDLTTCRKHCLCKTQAATQNGNW